MDLQKTSSNSDLASAISIEKNQKNNLTEITIIMPTQAYFISGIRDFTLNLIKNMTAFSEQWAYRFQSIIDELCNNAIEHGSKPGAEIKITFHNNPQEFLEIIVEDTGTATKHLSAKQITDLIAERRKQTGPDHQIRGRGLPKIVSEWTDELEFLDTEKGGIKTRVRKYLNNAKLNSPLKDGLENPSHIMLN